MQRRFAKVHFGESKTNNWKKNYLSGKRDF